MIRVPTLPKMLYTPTGFYCTSCDYYFMPELDRSGLPDCPVRWLGIHKVERSGLGEPVGEYSCRIKFFDILRDRTCHILDGGIAS